MSASGATTPGLLLLSLVIPVLLVTNVYLCNIYGFRIKRCCVKEFENRNSGKMKALWTVHRPQQQGARGELTEPFSMMRLSMTTPLLFCSHTISQKCPHVFGKGPCKHTRYTLYNTGHTNTTCSQPGTVFGGSGRMAAKAVCSVVSHPVPHSIIW